MKINKFQILFFFLLLWSTHQLLAETAPEATYLLIAQDSSIIKQDSLAIKKAPIPKKITAFDSVLSHAWNSPWKISKSTMNQYLYEDIGDIISLIPGTFLLDLGNAGQPLMFTRHGAATNQAIVCFDGRPLYDPITGESDLNLLPVGFINEIKMEQALSNSYLTNDCEILSVKSEKYVDEIPYSQIYYHKAGLGFSDVDFIFGQRIARKMNILVGGDIKSFEGKNNAYAYEHQNFRGKLEYNYSPGWRFEYSVLSNNFNRYIPGHLLANGNYNTPNARLKTKRNDHTLNMYGNLFNSDYQNFLANIFYSDLFSKLTDTEYNLKNENSSCYAGLNFQFIHKFWGQLFTLSSDFEHDWTNAADVGKHHLSFGSVFIRDDWEWREKFGLRLLTNFKVHELYSTNFTGGFSSYYKILNDLKLNLAALQSLRYPSFLELYAKTNFIGNPNLKNEIHQKIMAGVESNLLSNLQLKTYFYQKNIRHIIQIDNTLTTFQNRRNFEFYGFDFQLDYQPGSKFRLNAILSTIDNKDLYDFPNLQMSGNIQYNNSFFENSLETMVRLESKYIGERKSIVLNPYQYSASYAKLSPTFVLNATAILGFGKLKFFLMFENILNEKYQLIYGFPMRERTFHYGLRWEFWN